MQKDIITLRKHLSSIEDIIDKLEAAQDAQPEDPGIEISKIETLSKNASYRNHFISAYDGEMIQKYATILASFVQKADTVDKRVKQYFFVARIMQGASCPKSLSDVITDAKLMDLSDFETLFEEIKTDISLAVFDILLMISMDGKIDEGQMDYFCELTAYLSLDKKTLSAITNLCACTLRGDEDSLYQYAAYLSIAKLSCYLKNPIKEDVVTSLDALKASKSQEIVLVGIAFKNGFLHIDEYHKKDIKFLNCKFDNISSMVAKKTAVVFQDCYFANCKKDIQSDEADKAKEWDVKYRLLTGGSEAPEKTIFDNAVITCAYADFINCTFEKCGRESDTGFGIFMGIEGGSLIRCTFKECKININSASFPLIYGESEYGALVYTDEVSIEDCKFLSCKCYGNGRKAFSFIMNNNGRRGADYECLSIINSNGGSIEDCEFQSCSCTGESNEGGKRYNYIINGIGAMERDNKFTQCTVIANVGKEKWEISL